MKKLLLIAILAAVCGIVACTQSPQEKAEKTVTKYLLSVMDDPKSYEPISFDTLETVMLEFDETPRGKELKDSTEYWYEKYKWTKIYDAFKAYDEISKASYYINLHDSLEEIYNTAPQSEIRLKHSYRFKNPFGAISKIEEVFVLSESLDSVVNDYATDFDLFD